MRRALTLIVLPVVVAPALAASTTVRGNATPVREPSPAVVTTDNETPVLYDDAEGGNASGDDPAIWIHPTDDAKSMVITTAKEGGLRVYDLRSRQVQKIAATPAPRADGVDGRYNNVDILFGVDFGRRTFDVAVVSDRYNDQLRFWRISPLGATEGKPLVEVTAAEQEFLFSPDRETVDEEHTAYGVAAWQPRPGRNLAVVTQEGNPTIATVRVVVDDGKVGYTRVRHLELPSEFPLPDGTTWVPCEEPGVGPQLEGVSVDHRTDTLFSTQEDVGLWRIPLPLGSGDSELVDRVADFGIHDAYDDETEECEPVDPSDDGYGGTHLVADAEGLDVYYGPGGVGYVIVSSQGDDTYAVYSTAGRNKALGTFRIEGTGVDEINGSDGLAVTHLAAGRFAKGMLVTHDEPETGPNVDPERDGTNFSCVQWAQIARRLGLEISTRPGNDPRF